MRNCSYAVTVCQSSGHTSPYRNGTTTTSESKADMSTLQRRRKFMERPIEERREIMRRQAEALEQHYEDTLEERDDIQGGDIVEYDE